VIGFKAGILGVALLAQTVAENDCSGNNAQRYSNSMSSKQLTATQNVRHEYEKIHIVENGESENLRRYVQETTQPGLLGYITLFTLGRPIAYYAVKGPVTDCARELTPMLHSIDADYHDSSVVDSPNDEGTYGGNEHCHFFYTEDGILIRWSGEFLYSDKPIRLTEKPLVISVKQ
jgi:hypothetical protein